jgi:hypothetical protein
METQKLPGLRILPRYTQLDHIEPFMLPPPQIGTINRSRLSDVIDLTESDDEEEKKIIGSPLLRREQELIDLTDSPQPQPPVRNMYRMNFQSPIASLEVLEEETKQESPTSVMEIDMFNDLRTNEEEVDIILTEGTP